MYMYLHTYIYIHIIYTSLSNYFGYSPEREDFPSDLFDLMIYNSVQPRKGHAHSYNTDNSQFLQSIYIRIYTVHIQYIYTVYIPYMYILE